MNAFLGGTVSLLKYHRNFTETNLGGYEKIVADC